MNFEHSCFLFPLQISDSGNHSSKMDLQEEKRLDELLRSRKKREPLSSYREGSLLDKGSKMDLWFTYADEKLLDSSNEEMDEEDLLDNSSDEDSNYGFRHMTRDELKHYVKQAVESDGFDVDPLPAGIDEYGRLIPCKNDDNIAEEIARFAISHNNSEGSTKLKFERVIKYNKHNAFPFRFYVTFTATDINTGGTHAYQAKVSEESGDKERSVNIFRRKYNQRFSKEDEIRLLTIFAIYYYQRTTGQDLELVKGIVYDQHKDSCVITFKARDLSSCMVEVYQTEVVSRDPIENSTVVFFIKNPDPSTYQDSVPAVSYPSESLISNIRQVWGSSRKDGAGPFGHALECAKPSRTLCNE